MFGFGRALWAGLSRLRRLAASRLARSGFNPSRLNCAVHGHRLGRVDGWKTERGKLYAKRRCRNCPESFYTAEPFVNWGRTGQ
jgi:hypothetical protein